jgi:SAM-dependent methyltransferase
VPREVLAHYQIANEAGRLDPVGHGALELERTRELLKRHLPAPPAAVLDVGGGPGAHATWLAREGYEVHLVDAVPLHVRQARAASERQPRHPLASAAVGDARRLEWPDRNADAVLLLGPLYHLTGRADRVRALAEARRALRRGGVLIAAVISRFASALDCLARGAILDPHIARMVGRDLRDGQHRNPTDDPLFFTTAYFHRPEEPREEFKAAGLQHVATLAVEGPFWFLPDLETRWRDPAWRAVLLKTVRALEAEPSVIGASAHILAVGRRRD